MKAPDEGRFTARTVEGTVMDDMKETIVLPSFDAKTAATCRDAIGTVLLDPKVALQLHHFVKSIAQLHCQNYFHNFEQLLPSCPYLRNSI